MIPTIQHTGSHFVVGLFGIDVGRAKRPGMHDGTPNEVIFDHVERNTDTLLFLGARHPTIIPLRHPKVVAKSYTSRGKTEQTMCDNFNIVVQHFDALKPYYLPLDVANRQDYLDTINQQLGLQLETDWSPAGVRQNNFSLRYNEVQSSDLVNDFCEENKPFLDRFYRSDHA